VIVNPRRLLRTGVLAAALSVTLGGGVAVGQVGSSDDCYPIPPEGCVEVDDDEERSDEPSDGDDGDEDAAVGGAVPRDDGPIELGSAAQSGDTGGMSDVLARTGIETGTLVVLGAGLGLLGGVLMLAARRRRDTRT
jgi:LPXTG-motif cell wall-anchored protein